MQTIAALTQPGALQVLATPADLRAGQDIHRKGDVELIESTPVQVRARVKGFQRRTTHLTATEQALSWGCTCTSQPNLFCKHLVATVLAVHDPSAQPEAPAADAQPPAPPPETPPAQQV